MDYENLKQKSKTKIALDNINIEKDGLKVSGSIQLEYECTEKVSLKTLEVLKPIIDIYLKKIDF